MSEHETGDKERCEDNQREKVVKSAAKVALLRRRRLARHAGHVGSENTGADQADGIEPDKERSPKRSAVSDKRQVEAEGTGEHQDAGHDKVCPLYPSALAEREGAHGSTQFVITGP